MLRSFLYLIFIINLFCFFAKASDTTSVNESSNLLSCVEVDGSLTHSISENSNGSYSAYISNPVYYKKQSVSELEESKKRWKAWRENNMEGKAPQDTRKIGVALPLESGNVFSSELERLSKKVEFFELLFPPIENSAYIPFDFGSFAVTFASGECKIAEKGSLMKIYCQNFDKVDINGVKINERTLLMSAEVISEVLFDSSTEVPEVIKTPVVIVDFIVSAQEGAITRKHKISYKYEPNGNEKQCHIRDQKISSLHNIEVE